MLCRWRDVLPMRERERERGGDNSNLLSVYVRRRSLFRFIHPFRRVKRFYRLTEILFNFFSLFFFFILSVSVSIRRAVVFPAPDDDDEEECSECRRLFFIPFVFRRLLNTRPERSGDEKKMSGKSFESITSGDTRMRCEWIYFGFNFSKWIR